ncbi:MAG: ThuA domain-containing protein, partial [Verrucomicrobia bacterium]|nr:ThuA domain-containing protein [Verrucomicrobiota bacterium]
EGQRSAPDTITKLVFIGDGGTHGGRGNHEFVGGFILMARALHEAYPNVHAVVHSSKNWPKDFSQADAIVVGLNHGERAGKDPEIAKATQRGAGFMAVHFGVEVNAGVAGNNYLDWIGGYFEIGWSVNPWWKPKFNPISNHPTTRGLKPFSLRDEWYYHMRFVKDMKGLTPILSAVAPLNTVRKEKSGRGGNPDVYKAVSKGKPQHVAWAYERPDKGRGFGFTGMHLHANHANDSFRTCLLNGAAWVAGLMIPEGGVPSKTPSEDDLKKLIQEAIAAVKAGR